MAPRSGATRARARSVLGAGWTVAAGPIGVAQRLRRRRHEGPVVLVPPTVTASMGDQALVDAAHGALDDLGVEVRRASWDPDPPAGEVPLAAARGHVPVRGWSRLLAEDPAGLILLGADVMNGFYSDHRSARQWDLAGVARRAGVPTAVIGFSWNVPAACGPGAVRAARRAEATGIHLSCRDEVSAERASRVVGREVPFGADLAFLLTPDDTDPTARRAQQLCDAIRARGDVALVLNINGGLLGRPDRAGEQVEAVARAIGAMEGDGIGTVLVPHHQGKDERWAHAVVAAARRLGGPEPEVVEPGSAAAAKAIMATADLVVTGRMHVCIASLGVGTPVRTLDYQGKVEGLARHFPGVPLRVAETPAAYVAGVHAIARELRSGADGEREAIAGHLPTVRAAARGLVVRACEDLGLIEEPSHPRPGPVLEPTGW